MADPEQKPIEKTESEAAADTATREDEEDVQGDGHTVRSTISQADRRSVSNANVHATVSNVDEQVVQSVDEIKKSITFSPSITDAVHDTVPLMREMNIPSSNKDPNQNILAKAMQRVKEEFTEFRVVAEMNKLYDLYKSSETENSMLESQCHELQEKVKQYEARHLWDPRVLRVLLIAERYRQEKALVYDEKNEIEAELIDMSIEMKHLEDIIKNKNKDLTKCSDEMKKTKELEKHVEHLEVLLMRKDNEIQALNEQHENYVASQPSQTAHAHHHHHHKVSMFDLEDDKSSVAERLANRLEHLQSDKAALKAEIEEKSGLLHNLNLKVSRMKMEINDLNSHNKEQSILLQKKELDNRRLLNKVANLERNLFMAKDQLTVARAEVTGLSKSLEGCVRHTSDMTHELSMKQKENMASKRYTMEVLKCLEESRQENKACTNQQNTLLQETKGKEKDLAKINKLLSDKNMECELLSAKIFKIETLRQRQLELMKLTRINTTQMVREISGLRQSLVIERGQASKISCVVMRMQSQVEALQREYLSVLEKNALLVRSHEMSTSVIEQFEALKVVSDRRMGHLMKTNIDLYSQTTSQQEIALIQSHQFQLKENEIKGLLSRLEEEDHKVERMICKDKEKMNIIDHLHADMNNKEEKIKSLKSIIESYTQLNKSLSDKAEELTDQLRFAHTKSELVRRQRDLFGTRLLQAQAETQLCQTALHIAKETITDKSVQFFNMQNDLRVLILEIRNLRRKNKLMDGQAELIHTLRQELGQASKALELQKCKNAILEKTKMPQVHRWRSLQASDPSKYEMVMKNQLLIRRVIEKTEEIARLEELLKQKDTLYMSLRVLVQRRMDSQLSSEMHEAKTVIRKQNRQLKALTAELNMSNDDLSLCKTKDKDNQRKLNEIAEHYVREKAANLRKRGKKEMIPIAQIPSLPRLPHINRIG